MKKNHEPFLKPQVSDDYFSHPKKQIFNAEYGDRHFSNPSLGFCNLFAMKIFKKRIKSIFFLRFAKVAKYQRKNTRKTWKRTKGTKISRRWLCARVTNSNSILHPRKSARYSAGNSDAKATTSNLVSSEKTKTVATKKSSRSTESQPINWTKLEYLLAISRQPVRYKKN